MVHNIPFSLVTLLATYANEATRSALLLNFRNIGPVSLNFKTEDISPLNQTIKIYDRYLGGIRLEVDTADNITQVCYDHGHYYVIPALYNNNSMYINRCVSLSQSNNLMPVTRSCLITCSL